MTIRIMLADDHRMLREGLQRTLVESGFDVVGLASDGAEAVRLAAETAPDVILMDVSMPTCDGIEACRRIKAAGGAARIVMLTMHADEDVLTSAVRAGAIGYLTKDSGLRELADAVRLAANGDTVLSPHLARSMLAEAQRSEAALHVGAGAPEVGDPGSDAVISESGTDEHLVSRREEEVLQLIADGCSTTEVADRLYISAKTVKNHLASIYQKLDARDRTQAVVRAVRLGIVSLD